MENIKQLISTAKEWFDKYFLAVVAEMKLTDVLDILILTMMLFFLYRFIRERRAGRLARGLIFVAGVLVFSIVLNMRAMQFILENFYQVGMIAIIVIFQSDLRAALERFGSTPIKNLKNSFSPSDYKAIVEMADVISEAADSLARTQTGALIVIERSTKLGEYLGQGVLLNAEMSAPLIRNIFFNKAPMHDGALIVRNRRIYAAGCYLPLSKTDLNKDLGTRHRAALGVSEVSDAIVIVVSEETGTISIAVGGDLTRNYNYSSLKQALLKYLVPVENAAGKRRLFGAKGTANDKK
jgi:diadenylate cyclase